MRKALTGAVAILTLLFCVSAARVEAAPQIFSGTGAGATTAIAAFEAAIGGANNGGTPSPQGTGFRTINWDGVGLGSLDGAFVNQVITPNHTVGIPTNRFQSRGVIFEEIYAVTDTGFTTENPGLQPPVQFPPFSPNKIFAMFNDNTIGLSFVAPSDPGAPAPAAAVRGFGAIFLDVEHADSSSIEFFNGNTGLGKFFVPAASSTQPSFLGVLFDTPSVTRVTLTVGEGTLFSFNGTTVTPGPPDLSISGTVDQAATDDFVFSEPLVTGNSIPTLGTPMMLLLTLLLGAVAIARLRGKGLVALVALSAVTAVPATSWAKTEIQFWHALQAVLGERTQEIATKFNATQKDYEVKAIFKGSYPETLNAAIAAYRAKQPPHVVQVYEVGTQTMLSSGAVYPVYQLMKDNNITIDWNDLIGPVKTYYSQGGNLSSMAFNSSTPILYYNKDHFKKAGLPDKAPATWDEVEAMAKKLQAAGVKCPASSGWPSWVLVENMHAWHDQPFADHNNGFDGLATTLSINGAFGVKMMDLLARGVKEGWFTYHGRLNKAEANMGAGECGIFLTSSAYIGNLTKVSEGKFTWGTGFLPRLAGFPQGNSIIGGATLWVMKGAKADDYKGVAQFFKYIASTENQVWWAGITGYLPISNAAVKAMEASGIYQKNPHLKTSVNQMNSGKTTPNSQGIRLGNYSSIRDAIEEQMELIFSGKKTSKQGLDDAVAKSRDILKEFSALYK